MKKILKVIWPVVLLFVMPASASEYISQTFNVELYYTALGQNRVKVASLKGKATIREDKKFSLLQLGRDLETLREIPGAVEKIQVRHNSSSHFFSPNKLKKDIKIQIDRKTLADELLSSIRDSQIQREAEELLDRSFLGSDQGERLKVEIRIRASTTGGCMDSCESARNLIHGVWYQWVQIHDEETPSVLHLLISFPDPVSRD